MPLVPLAKVRCVRVGGRVAELLSRVGVKKKPAEGIRTKLAKLFDGACPNYVYVSKKYIRMPMGILKGRVRSWSLP